MLFIIFLIKTKKEESGQGKYSTFQDSLFIILST